MRNLLRLGFSCLVFAAAVLPFSTHQAALAANCENMYPYMVPDIWACYSHCESYGCGVYRYDTETTYCYCSNYW